MVDSENDASWKWFFERFRDAYGAREGMCIVSDIHESILKATSTVYPEVLNWCMYVPVVEQHKNEVHENSYTYQGIILCIGQSIYN